MRSIFTIFILLLCNLVQLSAGELQQDGYGTLQDGAHFEDSIEQSTLPGSWITGTDSEEHNRTVLPESTVAEIGEEDHNSFGSQKFTASNNTGSLSHIHTIFQYGKLFDDLKFPAGTQTMIPVKTRTYILHEVFRI